MPTFKVVFHIIFRGEYFLIDYVQKIRNFSKETLETTFQLEGISDMYNINAELLSKATTTISLRKKIGKVKGNNMIYDFVFVPNDGFLNSNKNKVIVK